MSSDPALSIAASNARLIHRPWAIANARAAHRVGKALRALLRAPWSTAWEFELRYRRYLAEFGESDDDILVSTYSKSGTTWMQMILYQLTTDGDMGFDHLFDISPWVYYSALREVPPASTPQPRILKSHDSYARFARGRRGRFIFVVRDGRDVCLSLFHHRRNFKRYDGSFEQHFD
ncbi:MAG: sulfotransferase domain-containing protein, partial [Sulfuritalea sp.]|nr:sulfotransferase domain-containing protein [Sulfuritalea sp.]